MKPIEPMILYKVEYNSIKETQKYFRKKYHKEMNFTMY